METGALRPFITSVSSQSCTGVKGLLKHKNPVELPWHALNISERGGGLSSGNSALKAVHVQPHFTGVAQESASLSLGRERAAK